jgi:cytidylate kinase
MPRQKTQRDIILQETTTKFAKKKLGKDLKKHNYQVFTIQLKVPFEESVKRNKKREKPNLNFFKTWTKERWNNKIQRKIKKSDIVVDTFENNLEEVVKIILKAIGEKAKKHPYEKLVRKFW